MVEAKASRVSKEVAGVVILLVLAAVLVIPLGLSLVALVPIGLLVVALAAVYTAWRRHQVTIGNERRDRERVELIGGTEVPPGRHVEQSVRAEPRPSRT